MGDPCCGGLCDGECDLITGDRVYEREPVIDGDACGDGITGLVRLDCLGVPAGVRTSGCGKSTLTDSPWASRRDARMSSDCAK